jgi:hypothetical protein
MSMLGDLFAFFSSVIFQWTAWVTGSVVAALLFILERRSNVQVPWHIIRWVFVWGGLLVAMFWAWQEEHTKVAQLGHDLAQAKQSRAWIGTKKMVLQEMISQEPVLVVIEIHNSGNTAALRVAVNYIAHASDVPLDIDKYAKHPIEKSEGKPAIFTLFPNATMSLVAATGSTDALGVESISNGKKLLYVFGMITYFDVFDAKHHTRFCGLYDPTMKIFGVCGSYDYAD